MSFDKSTYDVSEGDGGVDLTLQLSRPIPLNFTKDTLQLEIADVNASKLCSACVYVCVCLCVCVRACVHACVRACVRVCVWFLLLSS